MRFGCLAALAGLAACANAGNQEQCLRQFATSASGRQLVDPHIESVVDAGAEAQTILVAATFPPDGVFYRNASPIKATCRFSGRRLIEFYWTQNPEIADPTK